MRLLTLPARLLRAPKASPARPAARPEARVPDLDGLRGIAILLVIAVHTTSVSFSFLISASATSAADVWVNWLQHFGWCGVDLFFVLSGFLITGILLQAKGSTGWLRNFYIRRALRILPLYYSVLLLRVVLAQSSLWWLKLNPQEWLANLLHVGNFWQCYTKSSTPPDPGGLLPCWSLAVEEQFYLVWPLIVAATPRSWLKGVCLAGIVTAIGSRWAMWSLHLDPWFAYVLPFCRMDGLLMGAMVALAAPAAGRTRMAWLAVAAGAASVVAVCVANPGPFLLGRLMSIIGYTCFDLFFASILWLVLAGQPSGWRVLRFLPLRRIGERSFAIYLLHVPAIMFWFPLFNSESARVLFRPLCDAAGTTLPYFAAFLACATGTAFLAASVSWVLLERPMLSLKRHFPMPESRQ